MWAYIVDAFDKPSDVLDEAVDNEENSGAKRVSMSRRWTVLVGVLQRREMNGSSKGMRGQGGLLLAGMHEIQAGIWKLYWNRT